LAPQPTSSERSNGGMGWELYVSWTFHWKKLCFNTYSEAVWKKGQVTLSSEALYLIYLISVWLLWPCAINLILNLYLAFLHTVGMVM